VESNSVNAVDRSIKVWQNGDIDFGGLCRPGERDLYLFAASLLTSPGQQRLLVDRRLSAH